jgi:hypothetical protein
MATKRQVDKVVAIFKAWAVKKNAQALIAEEEYLELAVEIIDTLEVDNATPTA